MTTIFNPRLHPRNPLTGEWIDTPDWPDLIAEKRMGKVRAPDAYDREEPLPNPPFSGKPDYSEPEWYWVAGGCTYLATAMQLKYPDLKIAVADYHETISGEPLIAHAIAYNPRTGEGYDGHGVWEDYKDALMFYGDKGHPITKIHEDVSPETLAERMGYSYDPEEPYMNDLIVDATDFINYWFGLA